MDLYSLFNAHALALMGMEKKNGSTCTAIQYYQQNSLNIHNPQLLFLSEEKKIIQGLKGIYYFLARTMSTKNQKDFIWYFNLFNKVWGGLFCFNFKTKK